MGVVAIASLAISAASTIVQARQASKAESARREASAVKTASEKRRNELARRRAAREERVRRARLIAGAEAQGAGGSSALVGATSALGASFQSQIAAQSGQTQAAERIGSLNQEAASAETRGRIARGYGNLINAGLSVADESGIFD